VPESTWLVEGDVLLMASTGGRKIIPTADQIYTMVFGPSSPDNPAATSRHSITEGLPALTFSRFPLDLGIELDLGPGPEFNLLCTVVGRYQDTTTIIAAPFTRTADHAVVDSRWYPFTPDSLEYIRSALKQLGVTQEGVISLRQYLELRRVSDPNFSVIDRTAQGRGRPAFAISDGGAAPPNFQGELYPYQIDGWHWLSFVARHGIGGILADEMGLGKSVQTIALMLEEKDKGAGPSLVVTTATLLENWSREFAKFAPTLRTAIHQGANRTGFPSVLTSFDAVITSYETVVRDLSILKMVSWNIVILDEAQAIKNPSAQRTYSAKQLPRRLGVAVTGTPFENHLTDLWSLTDFVIPEFLGDLTSFQQTYTDTQANAAAVEAMVTPLILRRLVKNVAQDLPPRIDIPQVLALTEDGVTEYETLRDVSLASGSTPSLGSLTTLRMYCAHPFLLKDSAGDPALCSPKLARLLDILEEIFSRSEKALVFASFTKMVDIIVREVIARFGTQSDFIDGRVAVRDRQKKIDLVSNAYGPGLLVLNPRAAGTGLNIASANHVIHYTLEWNPAVEDQASARAHRLGQTRPVMIYRLFYRDTVEDVINQRLTRKRLLAERAVVGTHQLDDDSPDLMRALRASPIRRA
jgi:SNF2 family DNA or RNA helicase